MTSATNQAQKRPGRPLPRVLLSLIAVLVLLAVIFVAFLMLTRFTPATSSSGDDGPSAVALAGGRALVGPNLAPLDDSVVLVRDGVIESIGPRTDIDIPDGVEVVELDGATLMPGLIDMHVHLGTPQGGDGGSLTSMPRAVVESMRHGAGQRRALLEHGVTTVRSLGDDTEWVREVRAMIEDGELEGPRVLASGAVFTSPGGHPIQTIHGGETVEGAVHAPATADEAREAVRGVADGDDPVDLIKIIHDRGSADRPLEPLAAEVLDAIVAEAGAHGRPVVAHWGTTEDLEELLAAGIDGGLEHLELRDGLDTGWPPEVLESLVESGLSVTPTLAVTQAGLGNRFDEMWPQIQGLVADLTAAQVPLVAGSDAPINGVAFGSGLHRELEQLVDAGLSPTEALQAATTNAAAALRSRELGVISPGRAADLLVLGSDPREDLGALDDVIAVFRDGRLAIDNR